MKKLISLEKGDFLYVGVLFTDHYFCFKQEIINTKNESTLKNLTLDKPLILNEFYDDSYVASINELDYTMTHWDYTFDGIKVFYGTSKESLLKGMKKFIIEHNQELENMKIIGEDNIRDINEELEVKEYFKKLK